MKAPVMLGLMFATATSAEAKGCLTGALAGGVAGHYVHHTVTGAIAGCYMGSSRSSPGQRRRNCKNPAGAAITEGRDRCGGSRLLL